MRSVETCKGFLEQATHSLVRGWAFDEAHPNTPVVVDVFDGEKLIGTRVADEFRSDLVHVPGTGGRCGFSLYLNPHVLPLSVHQISVRVRGGADLENSPTLVKTDPLVIDEERGRLLLARSAEYLSSCADPADVNLFLGVMLQAVKQCIDRYTVLKVPSAEVAEAIEVRPDTVGGMLRSVLEKYQPIEIPYHESPVVSIVIPVYNKFDYTYDCVKSIAENLPSIPFEIIIVDDVSLDETIFAHLLFSAAVRVLRNRENSGFVRTCNFGASIARGSLLFFLNNDTKVKTNFLDVLVETFTECAQAGIVGSKLVFPDGSLQECGGLIWRQGDGWNWGRGDDPDHPKYMFLRDVDYVSGAALMVRRDIFEKLNGFDLTYVPAYYEDTDLCFRVRELGYRVLVQPASVIVHFEGISSGTDVRQGVKRYQIVNHKKFFSRWGTTLSAHRLNGDSPELESERCITKRALFIDDSVPTPDQDAGSNAALQHMKSLQRLGHHVIFIPGDNMAKIEPYTGNLERHGIECVYHPYFTSVEDFLKRTSKKLDVVYLHRNSNATKYAGLAKLHAPAARLLYNVADLHYLRMHREAERLSDKKLAKLAERMKVSELSAMSVVDAIIVHSGAEADILARELPAGEIYVLPWVVPVKRIDGNFVRRSGIGFLGGFSHSPNLDAAAWLISEIMPLVAELGSPEIICHVAGSKMPAELRDARLPNLEPIGWVASAQDFFSARRLSVAPLRYGAGIKGKVLESMSVGTPCIMTSIAAEGLQLPEDLRSLVADDALSLARCIRELHDDIGRLESLSVSCIRYIEDNYSAKIVDEVLGFAVTGDA